MNKPNGDNFDFEIVDSNTVQFVKRGRKSNTDPKLVEKLKELPKGKTLQISKLSLDANSPEYKNEKGKISARIRAACSDANLTNYRIRWSVDGVPFVEHN